MSKERLEEIKEHVKWTVENGLQPRVEDSDLEWLINRVEELEEERDEWKYTAQSYYMTNQELRGQNKRYKQALERIIDFYPGVPNADFIPVEMLFEIKGIARRGLEGEK